MKLTIGNRVTKTRGYPFPGIVVSRFFTTAGELRYVVEATGTAVTDEMVRKTGDYIIGGCNVPEQEAYKLARLILTEQVAAGQYAGMLHIFAPDQIAILAKNVEG